MFNVLIFVISFGLIFLVKVTNKIWETGALNAYLLLYCYIIVVIKFNM